MLGGGAPMRLRPPAAGAMDAVEPEAADSALASWDPEAAAKLEPPDKGHAAYAAFLVLGVGTLFPWNALITAVDYFEALYPGRHVERLFTVCYLPVNLAVLSAMLAAHRRISSRLRILTGFAGFLAAVAAIPLLDIVAGRSVAASSAAFTVTLLLVAATGACDGLAQGALFGEAALLPSIYTQALVAGTAVSGVAASLLRVATKGLLPATPLSLRISAGVYFAASAAVCGLCLYLYAVLLPRLPVVCYFKDRARLVNDREHSTPGVSTVELLKLGDQSAYMASQQQQLSTEGHDGERQSLFAPGPEFSDAATLADEHRMLQLGGSAAPVSSRHADAQQPGSNWSQRQATLRQLSHNIRGVWQSALSVCLVYVVTLSIFPGFLAEDLKSQDLGDWFPILLITAFNIADLVGKSAPAALPPALVMQQPHRILSLTLARFWFVPVFWLAASRQAGPAGIGVLTLALGLSNGYLTAVAMMEAPQGLSRQDAEAVGNIMVFALILGLCIGAACGFLWLL